MRIVRFTVDLSAVRELRLRRPAPERGEAAGAAKTAPATDPGRTPAPPLRSGGPVP